MKKDLLYDLDEVMVSFGFKDPFMTCFDEFRTAVLNEYSEVVVSIECYQTENVPNQFYIVIAYRDVYHVKMIREAVKKLAQKRDRQFEKHIEVLTIFKLHKSKRPIRPIK